MKGKAHICVVGGLLGALIAACRAPCPTCPAAAPPPSEPRGERPTPTNANPPPDVHRQSPSSTPHTTCVEGLITARGTTVLPVKRARVYLTRGESYIGETITDEAGSFVWCFSPQTLGTGMELTVTVEKPPFERAQVTLPLVPGQHGHVRLSLVAPGLNGALPAWPRGPGSIVLAPPAPFLVGLLALTGEPAALGP